MSRLRWSSALLSILVACETVPESAFPEAQRRLVEDSVRQFLADYADRVNRAAWPEVAGLYADDPGFLWVEDGRVAYTSADSVRAALASVGAMFTQSKLTHRDTRVVGLAPGLASMSTLFEQTLADSLGQGFSFSGAITATVIHTADGWKFLSGHTSTAKPR